jgi:hypothetical protein
VSRTYDALASQTLTANTSAVEFTGIPTNYTDLAVVMSILPQDTQSPTIVMRVGNGSFDAGSNYSATELRGNGSAAASQRNSSVTEYHFARANGIGATTTTPFTGSVHLLSYANTSMNKTILSMEGSAANGVSATAGLWRSTAAIDRVRFFVSAGGFGVGSTFQLFGVRAES